MAINTFTHTVELEFERDSNNWTDISTFLDTKSGIRYSRGISVGDRQMRASTFSCSVDNSGEEFTSGNASSAYFNKIQKGIGIRYSWTYSGTTKYEFRGYVTEIKPKFAERGRAGNRVEFSAQGQTSYLREFDSYSMPLQSQLDVDDAIAAVMAAPAVNQPSGRYSLADSAVVLPWAFARKDALTDIVAFAAADPSMLLFEDGQGRLRLKSVVSGNHASPDHTWGSTIAPVGDVVPDYKFDSQFGRASLDITRSQPTVVDVELWRHPLNYTNGFCEAFLDGYHQIAGEFNETPISVVDQFVLGIVPFGWNGGVLDQAMTDVSTTLRIASAFSPNYPGEYVRVDNEVMLITAITHTGANGTFGVLQICTVTRAQMGTVAAAHVTLVPTGKPVYRQAATEVLSQITPPYASVLNQFVGTTSLSWNVTNATGKLAIGDYLKCDNEIVRVTSITGDPVFGVARAQLGTSAASHVANTPVYRRSTTSAGAITAPTYLLGSDSPDGVPAVSGNLTGAAVFANGKHITWSGRKFIAAIYNSGNPPDGNPATPKTIYLAEAVIGGRALRPNDKTAKYTLEKAVPNMLGIQDGPAGAMPYGTQYLNVAQGQVVTSLLAGRVPTPWLPITFDANVDAHTVSMQTLEVADFVRYTGTGTYREKIDEWYRVAGLEGSVDDVGRLFVTVTLAPSHLWRRADLTFWTMFNKSAGDTTTDKLGAFDILPQGSSGWSNAADWQNLQFVGSGIYTTLGRNRGWSAVANPAPAVVNVGSADMIVVASWTRGPSAQNTFSTLTGGYGVTFRANAATPSTWWEARFNPTAGPGGGGAAGRIYLWNAVDGVAAYVDWYTTESPEIEVRCQGNRIRVFVDCRAEPVIDFTSTRYNTQTYAGPSLRRTIVSGGGSNPYLTHWAAQAL
jgi:hypothetical protein